MDIMVNGLTAIEISRRLASQGLTITSNAVKHRLRKRDVKPIGYIGPTAIYAEDAIREVVKEVPTGARSPKYQRTRGPLSATTET